MNVDRARAHISTSFSVVLLHCIFLSMSVSSLCARVWRGLRRARVVGVANASSRTRGARSLSMAFARRAASVWHSRDGDVCLVRIVHRWCRWCRGTRRRRGCEDDAVIVPPTRAAQPSIVARVKRHPR